MVCINTSGLNSKYQLYMCTYGWNALLHRWTALSKEQQKCRETEMLPWHGKIRSRTQNEIHPEETCADRKLFSAQSLALTGVIQIT
jgi:hypothetical protein